jgi:site-specific DNA recombinase
MSMKDRDHGRVRIHCTTTREAGVCSNREVFYMDEVERIVLGGLQQHLKAPHLLREFAEAYQQERQRLAQKRMKRRSQIESELAQLQRSIDRVWDDYFRERIPGDMVGPKLNELKSQKEALAQLRGGARRAAGGGEDRRTASRCAATLREVRQRSSGRLW